MLTLLRASVVTPRATLLATERVAPCAPGRLRQGNLQYYSEENMVKRLKLMRLPAVAGPIHAFWVMQPKLPDLKPPSRPGATHEPSRELLGKEAYVAMIVSIQKSLDASSNETIDEAEARALPKATGPGLPTPRRHVMAQRYLLRWVCAGFVPPSSPAPGSRVLRGGLHRCGCARAACESGRALQSSCAWA